MKKHLRNYVASAMLLAPVAATLLALPSSALAQSATPELRSLQVMADSGIDAGSTLSITLIGTPRGEASVRIGGLRDAITLTETDRGVYQGRYTIRRSDRIGNDAQVQAVLRQGNRSTSADYLLADAMPRQWVTPPVARQPDMRIDRFGMAPVDRVEPGVELNFAVEGMAGARVTVDLPGVERDFPLRETRPGYYEGGYTLRRGDNLDPSRPAVAALRSGERTVFANLNLNLPGGRAGIDNRPPTLIHLVPGEGTVVAAGPSVHIAGTFDDARGSGVEPASVQIIVSGRNVTRDAQINRQSFSFWGPLPPGRHTVDVSARDQAGNAMRKNWTFDVGVAAAAPVLVPVLPRVAVPAPILVPVPAGSLAAQVLNHYPNAEIGPDPVLVRARTAPFAQVAVTVRAVAPAGLTLDHSRTIYSQTLQADGEGIFSFTMVPGIPVPGTRYDIEMVSRRDSRSVASGMSLLQR